MIFSGVLINVIVSMNIYLLCIISKEYLFIMYYF